MDPLESELQARLLLAAPAAIPDLRFFRRNIGKAQFGKAKVAFGIAGQSDLYGIFRNGLHIEAEIKAADGRLSKEQLAWQSFCRAWGIPHLVLRALKGESVEATVLRWLGEIRALSKFPASSPPPPPSVATPSPSPCTAR